MRDLRIPGTLLAALLLATLGAEAGAGKGSPNARGRSVLVRPELGGSAKGTIDYSVRKGDEYRTLASYTPQFRSVRRSGARG